MTKLDVDRGNQGILNKSDFKDGLQEFFAQRDEENIVMLVKAAETELDAKEADTLDYKSLFFQVNWNNSLHTRTHTHGTFLFSIGITDAIWSVRLFLRYLGE